MGVRLDKVEHSFFIYAIPFGNCVEVESGIRCMVSTWRRVPDQSLPARAKITGSYAQSALAESEAVGSGFDQAIPLTRDRHPSGGSAANPVLFTTGAVFHPPGPSVHPHSRA